MRHHIRSSYDETWATGPQAESWLDDHVNGVQDAISTSTALLLPVDGLAKLAETQKHFWKAALRWNACATAKLEGLGTLGGEGMELVLRAANNAKLVVPGQGIDLHCTDWNKDTFLLISLTKLVMQWIPDFMEKNGWVLAAILKVMESEASMTTLSRFYQTVLKANTAPCSCSVYLAALSPPLPLSLCLDLC